ncbi:serine/threonine-protein kinase [Kitasatospora sp. SolWspMP-SS2h]|uniref:serine/threonine-protein kinase n=1 Tax=Kitasatospora sp. SolWspMP-SS2h TaxID=1305729 RepID=UPI000DB9F292|nr:serine/threonine-protein kinase [Kitasatospora sp. SolWspMP-SS2h]RAJ36885.1 serine/threonine-protein kinase [Kitasatospora sp. SolWspMP-SS2h]
MSGERPSEPPGRPAAQAGPPPAAAEPGELDGRTLAGYRLEHVLGRGGMAVVYRAEDLRLGRTVAVKLLAPELARNENFRQRFVRESHVAASLDHPNIVPVYDAGEAEGVLYLAMRYVRGRDLRALLDRQGPLTAARTVRIAVQVAGALDAAHAHDLVHRDVKPGNVLIAEGTDPDRPEHAYLTDFGLTKKSLSLTGLTSVGQFVGTLDYVAPEQISGKPVDGRCDVYSLGCVVFEMLTGGPPYRRDDDLALLWAHLNDPPPDVRERRADLPAGVGEVLERAMAKRPGERYGSCLEFVAALRAATDPRSAPRPASREAPRGARPAAPEVVPGAVPGVRPEAVPGADRPPRPPAWARPVFEP